MSLFYLAPIGNPLFNSYCTASQQFHRLLQHLIATYLKLPRKSPKTFLQTLDHIFKNSNTGR